MKTFMLIVWTLAQSEMVQENELQSALNGNFSISNGLEGSTFTGCRCFVDGSWKEDDILSGIVWVYSIPEVETPSMGAANLIRSLAALHTVVEALIWAMTCMIGEHRREVVFLRDCSDLVEIVSSPATSSQLFQYT